MATLNETIAQAQEAAANVVDAEVVSNVPAAAPAASMEFQKPSMETLGNTVGIAKSVDTWLKVNQYGLFIGDVKKPIDAIDVSINLVEEQGFFVKYSIKWGNPVQYASSYDGVVCDKGGSWADTVMRVQAMDPKAKVFNSADIIMTLTKDVKIGDKVFEAGTKIGHTLSMSNWQNWVEFYREASNAGLAGQEIGVHVGYEEVNGKNGYTWGVATFRPIGN